MDHMSNRKHLIISESDKKIVQINKEIQKVKDEKRLFLQKEEKRPKIGLCKAIGNRCPN